MQPVSVAEPQMNQEVVACSAAGSWVQQVAGTKPLPLVSCCGKAGRREGCRDKDSTAAGRPLELCGGQMSDRDDVCLYEQRRCREPASG